MDKRERELLQLSAVKKAHYHISEISQKPIIKHFIGPIIFLLPVAIITSAMLGKLGNEIPSSRITSYINCMTALPYPRTIAITILFIYGCLTNFVVAWIREHAPQTDGLSKDILMGLITSINGIVELKAKRMGDCAHNIGDMKKGKTIFLKITQPGKQLFLLITALRTIFEKIDPKTYFRICLFEVKNDKLSGVYYYAPDDDAPKTPLTTLSQSESTIMSSIRDRKMIIIEDIQKELKKDKSRQYVRGTTEKEPGSQLCYPIVDRKNNVIYVVAINGDRKRCLELSKKKLYSWVIAHIVLRIKLENSLLKLKESVENGDRKSKA